MIYENSLLELVPFDIAYLLIGIVALNLILLIIMIVILVRNSRLKKNYRAFMQGSDAKSLESLIQSEIQSINDLKDNDIALEQKIESLGNTQKLCYQKSAIVKYDALNMGGQMSFVFCLLNNSNDGILLNSIHTREGSYLYMKEIKNGTCQVTLGKEEEKALANAMT